MKWLDRILGRNVQDEGRSVEDTIMLLETEAKILAQLGRHHKRLSRGYAQQARVMRQRKENDERNRLHVRTLDPTKRDQTEA